MIKSNVLSNDLIDKGSFANSIPHTNTHISIHKNARTHTHTFAIICIYRCVNRYAIIYSDLMYYIDICWLLHIPHWLKVATYAAPLFTSHVIIIWYICLVDFARCDSTCQAHTTQHTLHIYMLLSSIT